MSQGVLEVRPVCCLSYPQKVRGQVELEPVGREGQLDWVRWWQGVL